MKKNNNQYFPLIGLIIFALILYELTVSNGLYIADTELLGNAIELDRIGDSYLFQSSPLYAGLASILSDMSGTSPFIILSQLSVIFIALSIIPLWFILERYFGKKFAFFGCLMYIFIPFIWFNAINAKTYAMSLFFSTLFIYLLLTAKKNLLNLALLSILFGITVVIHTINIFLLPLFLVYLDKNKQRIAAVGIAAVIFLSIRFMFGVPFFPQSEYALANLQPSIIIYSFGMNFWALFNSLGIATFILVFISAFLFLAKSEDGKLALWLAPVAIMLVYGKDSIAGIISVMPFMIFLIAYFFTRIKDEKKVIAILLICITLAVIKFLPFALLIRQYQSPHQIYADAIISMTQPNDVILGGHEGAWLFGERTFYTPTGNFTIENNTTYYMTMHFVTTENRFELEKLAEQIGFNPFGLEIERNDILFQKRCNCSNIERPHNFEDPYLYFMSVTPSIPYRLILLGDVSYKTDYWICKVCL